jgi:hypothetical protein
VSFSESGCDLVIVRLNPRKHVLSQWHRCKHYPSFAMPTGNSAVLNACCEVCMGISRRTVMLGGPIISKLLAQTEQTRQVTSHQATAWGNHDDASVAVYKVPSFR